MPPRATMALMVVAVAGLEPADRRAARPPREPTPGASAGSPGSVAPDQRVGRAVVGELGLGLSLQLRNDPLGQRLAQLDPPLVEGIDGPDGPLGEDAVLVQRHQR